MRTGQFVTQMSNKHVSSIAFSPNGKLLAAGGNYYIISVWDLKSTNLIHQSELPGQAGFVSVAFLPHNKLIALDQYGDRMQLWDVRITPR